MASGLLPKSPVSSSLCDEVPHIFIPKSHLEPREFLISSAKRLLQQYVPITDSCTAADTILIRSPLRPGRAAFRYTQRRRLAARGVTFLAAIATFQRCVTRRGVPAISTSSAVSPNRWVKLPAKPHPWQSSSRVPQRRNFKPF